VENVTLLQVASLRTVFKLLQFGEHDWLLAFVGNHNVASRWHIGLETSQRGHHCSVFKCLVAETATRTARVAKDSPISRPLDELIFSFQNLKVGKDTKLHGSTGMLATHATALAIEKKRLEMRREEGYTKIFLRMKSMMRTLARLRRLSYSLAPAGQRRITRHLSLKGTAVARIIASGHIDFEYVAKLQFVFQKISCQ